MVLLHIHTAMITLMALVLYFWTASRVGSARSRFNILPPTMTGPEDFERIVRVHQNTLENLMLFIPALWICSIYFSPNWAAVLGLVWIIGRVIYVMQYTKSTAKRLPGFIISLVANGFLILLAAYGVCSLYLGMMELNAELQKAASERARLAPENVTE